MDELHSNVQRAIDVAERWFAEQTCDSVVSISDRLLIRTLLPDSEPSRGDLAWLGKERERLLAVAVHQAEAGELHLDAPALLVPLWAWPRHRWSSDDLRAVMAPVVSTMVESVDELSEPIRSAFLYWVMLTGIADGSGRALVEAFQPGPHPVGEAASLYHDTHIVYYATEYGSRPTERAPLAAVATRLEALVERPGVSADLLAEAVTALISLRPINRDPVAELVRRVTRLQHDSGDFGEVNDDFDQRHHATCVAWLALSRWLEV